MDKNRTYFMRRAAQERAAADHAADFKAKAAHLAMAEHYSGLVPAAIEPEPRTAEA